MVLVPKPIHNELLDLLRFPGVRGLVIGLSGIRVLSFYWVYEEFGTDHAWLCVQKRWETCQKLSVKQNFVHQP